MPFLNVNNKAVVEFTNQLEKMRKADFPLAIRGTLNKAAFNVKQVTMPSSADRFVKRKPNFFKANSKVQPAQGFSVPSMQSIVGFVSTNANYNHAAVLELQEQEYGGDIGHRSLIPLNTARTGGSNTSAVRPGNRLKTIAKKLQAGGSEEILRKAVRVRSKNSKQDFIRSAIFAGKGGFIIAGKNKKILYEITSIQRDGNNTVIGKKALYSVEDGRTVDIQGTGFMREATLKTSSRLEKFYIEEANRRFARAIK